jgi:hypothetical protein
LTEAVVFVALPILAMVGVMWLSVSYLPPLALPFVSALSFLSLYSVLGARETSEKASTPLPLEIDAPEGIKNEKGKDCGIIAVMQALKYDPPFKISPWLQMTPQGLRDQFLGLPKGQLDAAEVLSSFYQGVVGNPEDHIYRLHADQNPLQALPRKKPASGSLWFNIKVGDKSKIPLRFTIEDQEYILKAFIVHRGQDGSGHNLAYIWGDLGNYYRCDDATITRLDPGKWRVAARRAYLLLYTPPCQ